LRCVPSPLCVATFSSLNMEGPPPSEPLHCFPGMRLQTPIRHEQLSAVIASRKFSCKELHRGFREEEEEEEEDFVFNDTVEGPRAPAVKPGRITQA
jgi:hypothetical protein